MRWCYLFYVWLTLVSPHGFCTDLQHHDLPMFFLKCRPRKIIPNIRNYIKMIWFYVLCWIWLNPVYIPTSSLPQFHILEQSQLAWSICSLIDEVKESHYSYLVRPGFWGFPPSHLCRVSSVKDLVKPIPLEWSSRPHPQWPASPEIPKIHVQ